MIRRNRGEQGIDMKIVRLMLILLILWQVAGWAETGQGGQAGAFLRLPVGARPSGLGTAFTAISDDGSALSYNPAGLYQVKKPAFSGTYALMSLARKHFDGSLVYPLKDYGTIGVSATCLNVSKIEGRDRYGRFTGTFHDTELALNLGYCYQLLDYLSVGCSGKYLNHSLSTFQAHGLGFDAGLHSTLEPKIPYLKNIRLGLSVLNFGTRLAWDTPSQIKETIPCTVRGGVAVLGEFAYFNVLGTVDAVQTAGESITLHQGLEAWLLEQTLGLRVGYDQALTFGFSLCYRFITFSYAFAPDVLEIEPTSRFGIQLVLD